jgi:phenylacetic acid degradation operon negative regulatory protein
VRPDKHPQALQPQDVVLTIFGAYVRGPGDTVWSGGLVTLLGEMGFSAESARAALARLAARDLLARHREGRLVYYALSPRGHELLADGDRRIFSFARTRPGTDVWTVLWHAIPEDRRVERSRLASRLRFLGFGSVQDATWVAARDREQEARLLARELGIEPYTSVLVGRMSRGLPPVALVAQAWDLAAVARRYEAFVDEYGPLRRARDARALDARDAFVARTLLLHRFRAFPAADPELGEGDGLGPLRAQVLTTFDEVYAALEPRASAHFGAVARPHRGEWSARDRAAM